MKLSNNSKNSSLALKDQLKLSIEECIMSSTTHGIAKPVNMHDLWLDYSISHFLYINRFEIKRSLT